MHSNTGKLSVPAPRGVTSKQKIQKSSASLPGLALHQRIPASRWCIDHKDLDDFEKTVRSWHLAGRIPQNDQHYNPLHDNPRAGPSMYQVTEHCIKPITFDAGGMSYALMLHPEGLKCELFVTHAWAEGAYEFCDKVRRAWPRGANHLWCCFLANPQNGDIGELIGDNVLRSPFALALESASHMIAIPNSSVSIYTRLWCVLEAKLAMDLQVDITLPSVSERSVASAFIVAFAFVLAASSVSFIVLRSTLCAECNADTPPVRYNLNTTCVSIMCLVSAAPVLARCTTRGPIKHLIAEMLIIGELLGVMAIWWMHVSAISSVPTWNMEPIKVNRLQSFQLLERLLQPAFAATIAFTVERLLGQVRKAALIQEAHLLDFTSVRDANCYSESDANALWEVMRGLEESIDGMIKVLQAAGAYDASVRADLQIGMDPTCGRRVKYFRACTTCVLWPLCFQANSRDVQPATLFGYWTFYAPLTSFVFVASGPALVAALVQHDRILERRVEYVFNIMWKGALFVIAFYAVAALLSFVDRFKQDTEQTMRIVSLCFILTFSSCVFVSLIGPNTVHFIHQIIASPIAIRCLYLTSFLAPGMWLSTLNKEIEIFEACLSQSALGKDEVWSCVQSFTAYIAFGVAATITYAYLLSRYLQGRLMRAPKTRMLGTDADINIEMVAADGDSNGRRHEQTLSTRSSAQLRECPSFLRSCSHCIQSLRRFFHFLIWICALVLALAVMFANHESSPNNFWPVFRILSPVKSVSFSPDGRYVLTSANVTVQIWKVNTGIEVQRFEGHTDAVRSAAFSPDGVHLLTGSFDTTVRLWDVSTGKELRRFEGRKQIKERRVCDVLSIEDRVHSVVFSPDGLHVLTCSAYTTARLLDISTGRELKKFEHDGVHSVAFSPDGLHVLTGSLCGCAIFWEVSTGRALRKFEGHTKAVTSVAVSPDGVRVLTGSDDRTVRLWDVSTAKACRKFESVARVSSVAFSPDGLHVLAGSWDATARLWEVDTSKEPTKFEGRTGLVQSVAFSHDGLHVLTGSDDGTARLWKANTGKMERAAYHVFEVLSAAVSPNGLHVLTGSEDTTAKLWQLSTGKELMTFEGHTLKLTSVTFSPDGLRALTGSVDASAILWEVSTGKELRRFEADDQGAVFSVAFSPDGLRVVTGSVDFHARLWDVSTGRELKKFPQNDGVLSVAFSPDGLHVLTGSLDDTAVVWEVSTGRKLRRFKGHTSVVTSVAFSPDGLRVLTGSEDSTARLWDVSSGRELKKFKHAKYVNSVAFSPDGLHVLTGSSDGTAKIWDISNGKELREYKDPFCIQNGFWIWKVDFALDGQFLLTASGYAATLRALASGDMFHQYGLQPRQWLSK